MKEKLPPHLMKLAKKAGFCFWEDEHYGPGPDHIDWSSDYTDCLEAFAKLVAEECVALTVASNDIDEAIEKILETFGVK